VTLAIARPSFRYLPRQNYASRMAQDGLDLIEGEAHFTGPTTVEIALRDGGTRQTSAPVVVIDTGTRPRPLALTGAGDVPVLDSTSIMEDELPEHLIILGGGYIGLEFPQMFRRFGSEGPPAADHSRTGR
jgi:pyruvate/2-oxoglutarate dehydrogenase complex dihydrolipoamide dehydrogenase (E3) component